MKTAMLTLACTVSIIYLHAQSQGPLYGSRFTTKPIELSSTTWYNSGYLAESDDQYTRTNNMSVNNSFSDFLVVTDFGFAIPAGSTIFGITVEFERSDPSGMVRDNSVVIVKNNAFAGLKMERRDEVWPVTDTYVSYGGITNLWGTTWTSADINSSGFGIAISSRRSGGGAVPAIALIDNIRITVNYSSILPVRILDFEAFKQNNGIALNWKTTEESGIDRYEIERSSNGREFVHVGNVASNNVAGNTEYNFSDRSPLPGTSWYRLRIVHLNGQINYSKTVSVQYSGNEIVFLYPNPLQSGGHLYLNNPANEPLNIRFYNSTGQLVSTTGSSGHRLPVGSYPSAKGEIWYKIFDREERMISGGRLLMR